MIGGKTPANLNTRREVSFKTDFMQPDIAYKFAYRFDFHSIQSPSIAAELILNTIVECHRLGITKYCRKETHNPFVLIHCNEQRQILRFP